MTTEELLKTITGTAKTGIYRITNNVNGKSYIGQSIDINRRFATHRRAKGRNPLHLAIQKYGIKNFRFERLLEVKDPVLRDQYEEAMIHNFSTHVSANGYNIQTTIHGTKNKKSRKKGSIPWNKGLKGKQVAWNRGQYLSEEHKSRLRGERPHAIPWNKGLTKSDPRVQKNMQGLLATPSALKGKTYEELHGKERASELKQQSSARMSKTAPWKFRKR